MIKTALIGNATTLDADLLHLLLGHPDIVLTQVVYPWAQTHQGHRLSDAHPSLTGDSDLRISTTLDTEAMPDVILVTHLDNTRHNLAALAAENPGLRIITVGIEEHLAFPALGGEMTQPVAERPDPALPVYGMPEFFRKAMVRGSRLVVCPLPAAFLVELALLPIAHNLLLNTDIHGAAIVPALPGQPLGPDRPLTHPATAEAATFLAGVQTSFQHNLKLCVYDVPGAHVCMATVYFDCPGIDQEHLHDIFDRFYSDHNFTFRIPRPATAADVAGTNKCLLSVSKPDPRTAMVTVACDAGLKVAAGNALHCLNLLFGLDETTGLK